MRYRGNRSLHCINGIFSILNLNSQIAIQKYDFANVMQIPFNVHTHMVATPVIPPPVPSDSVPQPKTEWLTNIAPEVTSDYLWWKVYIFMLIIMLTDCPITVPIYMIVWCAKFSCATHNALQFLHRIQFQATATHTLRELWRRCQFWRGKSISFMICFLVYI